MSIQRSGCLAARARDNEASLTSFPRSLPGPLAVPLGDEAVLCCIFKHPSSHRHGALTIREISKMTAEKDSMTGDRFRSTDFSRANTSPKFADFKTWVEVATGRVLRFNPPLPAGLRTASAPTNHMARGRPTDDHQLPPLNAPLERP
jgi:hypothetical protein